ncbi:hypothetical protein [Neptunomonas japonica]|nr:hypothetical protein [Neptunomonas japonica]
MSKHSIILIIICGLFLSGCQIKPYNQKPIMLSGEQVKKLFVKHTVESYNLKTGTTSFSYYTSKGRVKQIRKQRNRSGHWKLDAEGKMCLRMQKNKFSCRGIYREGNTYYKYRLDNQNKLERIIRYQRFNKGNMLKKISAKTVNNN